MRPCRCGKPVRLGAFKIRVDRKPGVAHYIEHLDGSRCDQIDRREWSSAMLKPYPKNDADKPWHQMVARWDAGHEVPASHRPKAAA
jgi:hypothetical protein